MLSNAEREKFRREYYNPPKKEIPQPKIENKVGNVVLVFILLVLMAVTGWFIHTYKQNKKLEDSGLRIGQVWTEKIVQQSIYTLEPETIIVKKEIVNLENNRVYYHQEEPETTYTFYEADYNSFKENSTKIKDR